MQFRLLGPLEVVDGDRSLALGGRKQRSLLAMLLLHANDVLSTELLVDEVWGGSPPATVAKSVQVYVSRLRKELGDGRLLTRSPGYLLRVEPSELDLASGKHARLTGELEALVAEHPLRERLHGQLMLALYRSGRQAEALAAYQAARATLVDELGIGKSRLVDELATRARAQDAQVLVGRCWEAGGAPAYWPWVQALRGHLPE